LNTLFKKGSLSLAIAGGLLSAATAQAAADPDLAGKNVVLVHGAFADGSHPGMKKPAKPCAIAGFWDFTEHSGMVDGA
jgi:hypothetical protein